jgi:ABC-type uncharacterized transport system auxiliary subunit
MIASFNGVFTMSDLNHELAEVEKKLQEQYQLQREAKDTDSWWKAQRQILLLRPEQERILNALQGKAR